MREDNLNLVCESIVASINGVMPWVWLTKYGKLNKKALHEDVPPHLVQDYKEIRSFYRAYVEKGI